MQIKKLNILLILITVFTSEISGQYVWTQKTSMSLSRYIASGFVIGNVSYIGSGFDSSIGPLDDWWKYDPVADSWTQISSSPLAMASAMSWVINGKGYLGLGMGSVFYDDLYEYDPVSNTWNQKASFPGAARFGGASFALGTTGYICFGNMGSAGGPYSNEVYAYDALSDSWSQKSNFPAAARYGARAAVVNNVAYVFGGISGSGGPGASFYGDLWAYNPTNDSWIQKSDIPGDGRNYASVFELDNKLIVGNGVSASGYLDNFFAFDPITNSWAIMPALPATEARWAAVSFTIGSAGYVVSGNQSLNSPVVVTSNLWQLSLTSSVKENELKGFELYPTNVADIIHLNLQKSITEDLKIIITNSQGQVCKVDVMAAGMKHLKLDISTLKSGIYFTIISSNSHKIFEVRKFLKTDF